MSEVVTERIQALRDAIQRADWNDFEKQLSSPGENPPSESWISAGRALAAVARGEQPSDSDMMNTRAVDERLRDQIKTLADLASGDTEAARAGIVRELTYGTRSTAWHVAYQDITSGADDMRRHLFSSPDLVAGCVLQDGQIQSMAAKGSRMSADSLGHNTDQIWNDVTQLNKRVNLGAVCSMVVSAEDGAWVMVSDDNDPPQLVTALVAAPSGIDEATARAQVVIANPEATQ
jgi:hypothetical protein